MMTHLKISPEILNCQFITHKKTACLGLNEKIRLFYIKFEITK